MTINDSMTNNKRAKNDKATKTTKKDESSEN